MMATEDIEAGEVIVSVPKKFLMTNESISKLYGPQHQLTSHQLLALYLVLLKQDPQSWWKPYLELLPMHFNTMPVRYPPTLVHHLPDSLQQEVAQQRENIQADYMACMKYYKTLGNKVDLSVDITYDEYEWAWLCVNTRCIHMNIADSTKNGSIALAPMLDFLNHTTEAQITSGFNKNTQSFEITTFTPYKKGEQVYINYGPHDNLAMLREYGFVLKENKYNFVLVDKPVMKLFESSQDKKEILEGAGYWEDYSIKSDEISFRLMAALRLLAINQNRDIMSWHDVIMGEIDMIHKENERRALLLLQSICQALEKKSIEEINTLSTLEETHPHMKLHPFALYFVRQIWHESNEIIHHTLVYLTDKLHRLK
ncbi:hypothetical protein BDB01DRAFT_730281 [Pilobolus umbonatus]|nr:hypothetical protein BDB01DRAFT_730281 [Pilobolus umbonatus]